MSKKKFLSDKIEDLTEFLDFNNGGEDLKNFDVEDLLTFEKNKFRNQNCDYIFKNKTLEFDNFLNFENQ
jgi:hypothetical protein